MNCYFWDSGVIIGYCFYSNRLNLPGVLSCQIDRWCDDAYNFVNSVEKDENATSKFVIDEEIPRLMKRRKKCIQYVIEFYEDAHPNYELDSDLKESDISWIKSKIKFRTKYNAYAIVEYFTGLLSVVANNLSYLTQKILTTIHPTYDVKLKDIIVKILPNTNDCIHFCTCIDYHNNVKKTKLIHTDAADYSRLVKLSTLLKGGPYEKVELPECVLLSDYLKKFQMNQATPKNESETNQ